MINHAVRHPEHPERRQYVSWTSSAYTLQAMLLASCAGLLVTDVARCDSVYLTSIDVDNPHFARYDVATDAWTRLADYETNAQMAVSTAGELFARNAITGFIQKYHPASDTWSNVMAGPNVTNGWANLEVTTAGRFLYTEFGGTVVHYTDASNVWQTANVGITHNAMGDYDPTTNQYVVGEYFSRVAHQIDVNTFAKTSFLNNNVDNNGEAARFSSIVNGRYYFQYSSIPVHYFDLGNNLAPAVSTGVTLPDSFYNASAADRVHNRLFVGSLNGLEFDALDLATNTIIPLANYTSIGNHSSLAFVPTIPEPSTVVLAVFQLGVAAAVAARRRRRG